MKIEVCTEFTKLGILEGEIEPGDAELAEMLRVKCALIAFRALIADRAGQPAKSFNLYMKAAAIGRSVSESLGQLYEGEANQILKTNRLPAPSTGEPAPVI